MEDHGFSYGMNDNWELDVKIARQMREKLYKHSLLRQEAPTFFKKHFCQYPVVLIRFS
ncbi:hypothetical protein H4R20_003344, partial [Coemansia guatemalensis]